MGKRITQRRRGAGSNRYLAPSHRYAGKISYRKYDELERNGLMKGKIITLVDSVGHSAPLMKIKYENGEVCLQVAPEKVYENMEVSSGNKAEVKIGNVLPLKEIPESYQVFGLEKQPGDGGKLLRSTGTFAKIVGKTENSISLTLPSKKTLSLNPNCRATIGIVAGGGRKDKPFVKAGNKYHYMKARNKIYPKTAAVAMSAYNHPFGSGRGRHKGRSSVPKRGAPAGANVGQIRAKRSGRSKK